MRSPTRLHPLLLWTVGLVAVVVGAVVLAAVAGGGWSTVLALVALLACLAALGIVVRDELADAEGAWRSPAAGIRRPAIALGAVGAIALAGGIVAGVEDAERTATTRAGGAEAVQTVRDFLDAALVRGDGEAACLYLTSAEQARAAKVSGNSCRASFDAVDVPETTAMSDFRGLRAVPVRRGDPGGRRWVVSGRDGGPRFLLQRTTHEEADEFAAPASAWRVDAGAVEAVRG